MLAICRFYHNYYIYIVIDSETKGGKTTKLNFFLKEKIYFNLNKNDFINELEFFF